MKKYKLLSDIVLLAGLGIMSLLAVAPGTFVMPTSAQMLLLVVVLGLISAFLVFLWREQPDDEREAFNQAIASRSAYIVGASVLIIAMVVQSLNHRVDPAIPLALLAMIATKLVVQHIRNR